MYKEELITRLRELVGPILENQNIDLVDLTCFYQGRRLIVRFLVDKPKGGISLNECTNLNNQLSKFFDDEAVFTESYVLEVSSPGIDRPLKTKEDFLRVKDRNVELVLVEPLFGKKNLIGTLKEVLDDSIKIDIDGSQVEVVFANISHAVQKI
jgi:ribosome maturation factor RimP